MCDEKLQHWTRPVISDEGIVDLESTERAIAHDEGVLKQILLAGQNHYDDKKKTIIDDLGFQVCLSTDINEQEVVNLDFHCGRYSKSSGIVNSCAISLPRKGVISERLLQIDVLENLMDSIVQSWDPDWGTVISHEYLRAGTEVSSKNGLAPMVGWMTYLSNQFGPIPPMPEPVRVVSIRERGHLLVITDERFSTTCQRHLNAVREARRILEAECMLLPLQL
jgi:hypothetical protein